MELQGDVLRVVEDIKAMRIRGAGEIARSAVGALMLTAERTHATGLQDFLVELDATAKLLLRTRPTAVSLANGIRYVMHRVHEVNAKTSVLEEVKSAAIKACKEFIENSEGAIERIGEIGARRMRDGDTILTHCDSRAAISVMKTAWSQGKRFHVYVTETRPRFQGRLTAKELGKTGIPVTLIPDSGARFFMNEIDKVLVGADAVTANGAVVNKIGTSLIALAAHEAGVRVFVAAETYKFSPETMFGELVRIEEREAQEVIPMEELAEMPNVTIRNPAFDITPPEYIDLIITEKGIIPPQGAILILRDLYGAVTPEELKEYQTYEIAETD